MARRWGINPKRWFYDFREHLDPRVLAAVLAGSAAEQWLNGEFFRFIASALGGRSDLTVYPEWAKRDLVILPVENGRTLDHAVTVIETKVVYSNYAPGKIEKYVKRLLHQVSDAAKTENCSATGLLFAVHAHWPGQRNRPPKRDFPQFRKLVGETLRRAAARYRHLAVAKNAMETYLCMRTVHVGGATAEVAVAAQYVMVRPEAS